MRAQVVHHRSGNPRPRGVRVALGVSAVVVLLVLVAVVLPVWSVTGSADATTGGALDVPVGRIVGVSAVGLVVLLALAAGLVVTRRPGVAWALAVVVLVVALLTACHPLLATAQSAVDQGRDVLPWLTGLVVRLRG